MTASTAEDVIARALVDDLCIRCIGRRHRLAAAVVAAIRAMTVEQQAELIGGDVDETAGFVCVVGCPWRAEP